MVLWPQVLLSQSEAKDQCETVGRTDRQASDLQEPEQDTACALLSPAASWRSQSTAEPLACADTAGGPGHALLLWKVPPDQLQQGRMTAAVLRAACVWLGSPVPPGSCSGDFSASMQKMGENASYPRLFKSPAPRDTGTDFRPLVLLSDRGGSCQLGVELFSRQRCPPGSWLSCPGSPLKGHVQLDVQEMELIWKGLNLLL